MKWFRKLINAPSGDTVILQGLETWLVRWDSRYGSFHAHLTPEVQAFLSEEDAKHFAEQLRSAFKLLKHTGEGTRVIMERQA